ncbi:MAG: DUF721 domain-containing protein [Candidatus Ancillula sp.]|jgi:predicted nucleic acid-binding Zn ribbon protein|nr:DUF721 domain-containing protein [Candidatus Ancillula sp.]
MARNIFIKVRKFSRLDSVGYASSKYDKSPFHKHTPTLFGRLMEDVVETEAWDEELQNADIISSWSSPALVGAGVAEKIRAKEIIDQVLVVEVDDPLWATQVKAMTPQLIQKVNNFSLNNGGNATITDIKITGLGAPKPHKSRNSYWRR